jgi:starch-binding outer membrane protein, SusD/RagB family
MNRRLLTYPCLLLLTLLSGSCKKAFLDTLPTSAIIVPTAISDYQAILDANLVMNTAPLLGEVSCDDFYLIDTFWQNIDTREHNAYIWVPDIYQGQGLVDDWDVPYQQVLNANIVLEGLAAIPVTGSNQAAWNQVQGSALFYRAFAFYNLVSLFAPPYDSVKAATDAGIPLRLHSNITAPSIRASVQASYTQVLTDLRQAAALLPAAIPWQNRNRPSRPAALAALARVFLSMRNYPLAGSYADSALQLYDSLIDYNTLDPQQIIPFTPLNAEVLFQSSFLTYTQCLDGLVDPLCIVDSTLYRSYAPGDLRPGIFYLLNSNGEPNIKGSYAGTIFCFSGLATDELFLIRAESEARAGNTSAALLDINTLLRHRFLTGAFTPYTAASPQEALALVLTERQKELPFRGIRWTDLRRLNQEGYNISLSRLLNGATYTLTPNSNLYTLPIPPDVLADNPGMAQNGR